MRIRVRQRLDGPSPVWTADIHVAPAGSATVERFRLSAPPSVTSRSGAERWAHEQARKLAAEGPPPTTARARKARAAAAEVAARERVPTFGEWWSEYMQLLALERRKPAGQRSRSLIFKNWLAPLADLDLRACCSELAVQRLRARIAASPKKIGPRHLNGIVDNYLASLRRAARLRPHLGLVVPVVKPIRVDSEPSRTCYSIEHVSRMLAASHRAVATVLVLLMSDSGLRIGEVAALRWCDVDLGAREIVVRGTVFERQVNMPKSGKARIVPLTRRSVAALRQLQTEGRAPWVCQSPGGGPGNARTLTDMLRRLCRRSGIPWLACHALRHFFATESLRSGMDLRTLQAILGHSAISVTAAYLHASGETTRAAVDALEVRLTRDPAPVTDLALARSIRRKP